MDFDTNVLLQFVNPTIVVACLAIGFIIKNWVSEASNQIIPTCVFILGMILSVVITLSSGEVLTVETFVMGAISGLASTGLHQVFKTWIDNFGNKQ